MSSRFNFHELSHDDCTKLSEDELNEHIKEVKDILKRIDDHYHNLQKIKKSHERKLAYTEKYLKLNYEAKQKYLARQHYLCLIQNKIAQKKSSKTNKDSKK